VSASAATEPTTRTASGRVARRTALGATLGGLAVVGVTAAFASTGVGPTEERFFDRVDGIGGPIDAVLWLPMQTGSAVAPPLVGIACWLRWRRPRPALGAVVAGLTAWELAKVVKNHVQRGRPVHVFDGYEPRQGTPLDGLGFPSGHSAVAFALATAVAPSLPRRLRPAVFGLAATVGFARISVGAHLPLDVVGGAALGIALGAASHLA
jgi:undecaprenyl-diphosphatase